MQQVARYEEIGELRTEVDSFVQQVARYEGIIESRTEVKSFVQQVARRSSDLEGIVNHVSGLNHSCY